MNDRGSFLWLTLTCWQCEGGDDWWSWVSIQINCYHQKSVNSELYLATLFMLTVSLSSSDTFMMDFALLVAEWEWDIALKKQTKWGVKKLWTCEFGSVEWEVPSCALNTPHVTIWIINTGTCSKWEKNRCHKGLTHLCHAHHLIQLVAVRPWWWDVEGCMDDLHLFSFVIDKLSRLDNFFRSSAALWTAEHILVNSTTPDNNIWCSMHRVLVLALEVTAELFLGGISTRQAGQRCKWARQKC